MLIIKGVASLLAIVVCCGGGALLAIRPASAAQPFVADDFEAPGLHQWNIIRAAPDRLKRVTSPVRSGRYALRFTVADSDVKPLTATGNPRAQLNSHVVQREGMHTYIGWS